MEAVKEKTRIPRKLKKKLNKMGVINRIRFMQRINVTAKHYNAKTNIDWSDITGTAYIGATDPFDNDNISESQGVFYRKKV